MGSARKVERLSLAGVPEPRADHIVGVENRKEFRVTDALPRIPIFHSIIFMNNLYIYQVIWAIYKLVAIYIV